MSSSTFEAEYDRSTRPWRRSPSARMIRTARRRRSSTTSSPRRCGTSSARRCRACCRASTRHIGPILDLGAGTGAGTVHLHAAFPAASIVALEPSKAMRTALNARLAGNAGLRRAVTVVPRTFEDAHLPSRLSGVRGVRGDRPLRRTRPARVVADVGRAARARRAGADRRAPTDAPGADPADAVPEPARWRCSVYEGWMEGEPLDDRRMLWTMTYRVLVGDDVVYERRALSMWHTCGPDDVAAEVAALGLVVERPDPDHVVLRRPVTTRERLFRALVGREAGHGVDQARHVTPRTRRATPASGWHGRRG